MAYSRFLEFGCVLGLGWIAACKVPEPVPGPETLEATPRAATGARQVVVAGSEEGETFGFVVDIGNLDGDAPIEVLVTSLARHLTLLRAPSASGDIDGIARMDVVPVPSAGNTGQYSGFTGAYSAAGGELLVERPGSGQVILLDGWVQGSHSGDPSVLDADVDVVAGGRCGDVLGLGAPAMCLGGRQLRAFPAPIEPGTDLAAGASVLLLDEAAWAFEDTAHGLVVGGQTDVLRLAAPHQPLVPLARLHVPGASTIRCVATGRFDGTTEQVFVGSHYAGWGAGWLLPGDFVDGPIEEQALAVAVPSEDGPEWLGYRCEAGDLDGDGMDDLVVSSPGSRGGDFPAGRVLIFRGPLPPVMSAETADQIWTGARPGDHFGGSLALGDIDGDSVLDLVVGAPFTTEDGNQIGAAYFLYGPLLP